ncbi:WxL protein peptidoglycan domain-containing protein, partial [Listeria innocua]
MKKIFAIIFACTFAIICLPNQHAEAAEGNSFSVKAILPANQASSVTYFDLQMEPKQKQKLDVEITNQSKEQMTINCVANTAITNEMGYVDYSIPKTKPDETLKYPFADITEVSDSEITLEPNETKIWSVNIQMPEESYDGIILGGLHFKEKTKEKTEKETKQEKEVQIKNEYAYVIGVKLTEKTTIVKPELALNQIKAGSR